VTTASTSSRTGAPPETDEATGGRLGQAWTSYLRRSPRLLGALTGLFGLLSLVHAFLGEHTPQVIMRFAPVSAAEAATAVTAGAGLLLLRLSGGLRRGQKRAWRAAVVVLVIVVVAHVLRGIDIGALIISVVLLTLLLASRSQFQAKADVTSRWLALRSFVQMFLGAVLYGLAMLYIDVHTRVQGHPSFSIRLQEIVEGMVGVDGPAHLSGRRFPTIFHSTLLAFGFVIALTTIYLVLRPTHPRAVLSADDETRLRALLEKHGARDSLGYFALRRDKSVVWSPSGKAAITYRVVSGVALVSGDPVGDPEAWPGAIAEYQKLVAEYAWTPAVIGCSETGATIFRREAGLDALQLGDEAIIEVADFTLDGRAMRGVRQAVTRVHRAGYEVSVRRVCEVPQDEMHQLNVQSERWRGNDVERGYSMALSRMGDPADRACVVATATLDGKLKGILHFVPWGHDGLSLDLMRRDRGAENGLNELMIVSVIQAGPALGVKHVSLNFAAFREALERGERIGAGPVLRAWRGVLIFFSRWFQIESLYRFNVKFRPDWEPRFLSFPTPRALPRISVAALEAEAFITRPRLLDRVLRRS
jgi:lysyl-tRNA synthetase class 2